MFICLCNPFSDKKAKAHLEKQEPGTASVSKTYHACSGGEKPNCCQCLESLKELVKTHNKATPA